MNKYCVKNGVLESRCVTMKVSRKLQKFFADCSEMEKRLILTAPFGYHSIFKYNYTGEKLIFDLITEARELQLEAVFYVDNSCFDWGFFGKKAEDVYVYEYDYRPDENEAVSDKSTKRFGLLNSNGWRAIYALNWYRKNEHLHNQR